uniref:Nicotinate phosphoribosyltransferase n=1 Tax=Acetithermum autotrophicum TaxID=1446466 RepID=H5STH7_ACEAU|nr:nicotinate phosphoribosyltransferase [Candidatus Acetothermum autotrophicum]
MTLALFTDLYELTMAQAYLEEGLTDQAVFSVFVRRLPPQRNFLIACGLESVLDYLESFRFSDDDLDYLGSLGLFSQRFLEWLKNMRFTGDVYAVPEGTPIFPHEPILEVVAPLPQAQLFETFIMNQIQLQTMLASKAYRVVAAAQGRPVFDFAARRMHGSDAALKGARAFYIAGVAATSNVLAGKLYKIPVVGTMAHSYVQAHTSELEAFRAFARIYPETVLLVDTYDTLAGVRRVLELARELGPAFRVKAIRLDSGDLLTLSQYARRMLDDAGLSSVKIFASGGLDEERIAQLLQAGAPIDGFGVGTYMGVSRDAPDLDIVYKLSEYAGQGRLKLSPDKPIIPGRKQVFRLEENSYAVRDVIARADERLPGRPLLVPVMRGGKRLSESQDLAAIRRHAQEQMQRLPERVRALAPAEPPYPVELSPALQKLYQELSARCERREAL